MPNPKEVLRELARVLKTGGIAGFCEPGPAHSRSEGAQLEMRTSGVLESDFVLRDIWAWAQEAGFTRIVVKPAFSPWQDLSYDDYQTIARGRRQAWRRPRLVWSVLKRHFGVLGSIAQRTNFMLHKGSAVPDSRSSWAALGGRPNSAQTRDLQHAMRADQTRYQVAAGEAVRVRVRVKNTGSVRWLHANTRDFAVVKLGAHLHDADMKLLNHDFLRAHLERDVSPGEEASLDFSFTIDGPGRYHVVLDLVSEYVAWFAQAGSDPVTLEVVVS